MSINNNIQQFTDDEIIKRMSEKPQMYFQSGKATARDLVSSLCNEIIDAGGQNINIDSDNGWWSVSTDVDWLGISPEKYYRTMLKLDEGVAGGMRAGILITAFTKNVLHYNLGNPVVIKSDDNDSCNLHIADDRYGVMFKM